jgi:hypothetical protein
VELLANTVCIGLSITLGYLFALWQTYRKVDRIFHELIQLCQEVDEQTLDAGYKLGWNDAHLLVLRIFKEKL